MDKNMLNSHLKFHSSDGKRKILVADDEFINREILGKILSAEYDVLKAADGEEALGIINEYKDLISLLMLDIFMPKMDGFELLKIVKHDPELKGIPVIVLTSDAKSEVEAFNCGAADFIPKPYPQPNVTLARVRRTIELAEDRQIINATERDPLTGLYNKEYFFRYAEQYDHYHKDVEMDAMHVDVNGFHRINERFGTAYGDEVIRQIGERLRETVAEREGIVCRETGDVFLVYCPHGTNYAALLDHASVELRGAASAANRVRLRMGVYENVDRSLEIERRFDRAKMASDRIKGSFVVNVGIYDGSLHEKERYAEQLIEDFPKAIAEEQFRVFFQPKFNILGDRPKLASAEALVRWFHPTLGLISPGAFIPLFEENGLIQKLDEYVWRMTARHLADWKTRFDVTVPVSVNMSRADMYDPNLLDTLDGIVNTSGITSEDLFLEITESAYTRDTDQIIDTLHKLRELGFVIEMDDFGTGYSSLNMINALPIDAMKLDMQFIRQAFAKKRDTKLIEIIIDVARYLGVPVIAEGVETEEQYLALKELGCDVIQGYYFSKPVPAEEFERFLTEFNG